MRNAKEIKKNKILDTALDLFIQKGYVNTKIIDIAEGAGIGKGTVYEYFSSKEDLLLNIMLGGIDEYFEGCERIIHSKQSHTGMLYGILEFEIAHAKKMGPKMMLFSQQFMNSKSDIPCSLMDTLQDIWVKKFSYIQRIIADGVACGEFREVNVDLAALSIIGAAHSFLGVKYGLSHFEKIKLPFDLSTFRKREFFDLMIKGIVK
ncbi:TetR/AcrR family transcriptional regulator [Clostridium aminobutyricum]|uniref:TetR/AcrR family transcriptional regulator n=1 Tax=Clostridium aminobutyricum TaxID=33953 RepID=A0A939D6H9_CLOAM|nr:TetR/AcrR family transcriptional regulator [Clostridium aminobutyricum]MBN7772005.1 TetR/AcrR family transcriptional regulator [Clostridium aminobutyricum]